MPKPATQKNTSTPKTDLMVRPPVVVIMGHVDHGKTTLLDYIRKTNVAAREAGGITQSVGAYEITHSGKKITFIDTPGHEAFSKMRTRGAKVADIAIVVVAADEGVKPQTLEAIKIIQEANIKMLVAINKIDKAGVDENKVKNELTAQNVLLEGYGGSISYQPLSAKTGEGVEALLDLILLTAEVEGYTYNPEAKLSGFVLEAMLDSRRGPTAVAIVKDGVLRAGAEICAGSICGKIKILENFLGEKITEAIPSAPVLILGLPSLPQVGEEISAGTSPVSLAIEKAKSFFPRLREEGKAVNVILKADTSGSLEALREVITHVPLPPDTKLFVIDASVGDITEGDAKLAISLGALLFGFQVKVTKAAENMAKAHRLKVVSADIIYELLKAFEGEVKQATIALKGDLEILAVFGKKGDEQTIGGKVVLGAILNNATLTVKRGNDVLGEAKIINLQQSRRDVQSVPAGNECGLLVRSEVEIKVGDHLLLM